MFFGHGIGPKLNYQSIDKLAKFDYLFTACLPIHNTQSELFNPKKIYKVGLPILDNLQVDSHEIQSFFTLDNSKPTIIYAPSWCAYPECIADIDKALSVLNTINDANVIISPHPLLLKKDRCNGKDFFANHTQYKNLFFNFADSPFSTLDLCHVADIVISDISSILFESMALGKITLFENNKGMFEKFEAEKVYEQLVISCFVVKWETATADILVKNLYHDKFEQSRHAFIDGYIFNRGKATEKFIDYINELI